MIRHTLKTTAQMAKRSSGKSSDTAGKGNSRPATNNPFPGGNLPSKIHGHKSGGNRGQGPKA
ncbi:hypothetical protein DQ403_20490 [Stutzerimonas zhaodongensis]|jgi:hypothetical protein|uniref:Uncharacterized protein n=1 Tax=Stutzerimonas zhaodongensis TaxID=1176257 RepID=A0A365PPV2_9GAMM|nr:hypothetical protein C1896_00075 [Pseudomonadaceae bacterium SI-3]RBA52669.1 hypothetical protein DQ403_20490 [Stutzerimonas zhaodongensis]